MKKPRWMKSRTNILESNRLRPDTNKNEPKWQRECIGKRKPRWMKSSTNNDSPKREMPYVDIRKSEQMVDLKGIDRSRWTKSKTGSRKSSRLMPDGQRKAKASKASCGRGTVHTGIV